MKTKNASEEGKGKTMNNEHKHVPERLTMDYLLGFRDGLKQAREEINMSPEDRINIRLFDILDEIENIHRRLE
jgi:hypothetical protein